MLQIVLGQDDHGALGTQTPVDQALGDIARAGPGLGVANPYPVTRAAGGQLLAPRHEDALGRHLHPVLQTVRHACGVLLQGLLGTQVVNAGWAVAQGDAGDAKLQRPVFWGCHVLSPAIYFYAFLTLSARPSKKARTRSLASGALWAMAAIMASVIKPWSAG